MLIGKTYFDIEKFSWVVAKWKNYGIIKIHSSFSWNLYVGRRKKNKQYTHYNSDSLWVSIVIGIFILFVF